MRDLEVLIAVAEQGHIGRAASQRALTQPAVTKAIQRLEAEAGHPLFVRTPKGVVLTVEGDALLRRAREVRLALEQGRREINDLAAGHRGEVRFGLDPNLVTFFALEVCPHLPTGESAARISATTDSNQTNADALGRGELDFVFGAYPTSLQKGLAFETLVEDRIVVIARSDHPARMLPRPEARDLLAYSWAMADAGAFSRLRLEHTFSQHGLAAPKIGFESNSLPLILATVAGTDLLGYQPRYVLLDQARDGSVAELPTTGVDSPRIIGLLTRDGGYLPPAAATVCDVIRLRATARLVPVRDQGS
ncbi:MAG: LysR family transcriptional regulator [Proteobacteria bacterium]|nr:LysR family transcriptional regulator [Burkholderiales bacterium]